MQYNGLRKKPTYESLIHYLQYEQPIIKFPNRKATQITNILDSRQQIYQMNNVKINKFENIKVMFDKTTQKDYALQNYDLFPEMYYVIDSEVKSFKNNDQNKKDKMTQTVRYILKDTQTPYSSLISPASDVYVPSATTISNYRSSEEMDDLVQPESQSSKYVKTFFNSLLDYVEIAPAISKSSSESPSITSEPFHLPPRWMREASRSRSRSPENKKSSSSWE